MQPELLYFHDDGSIPNSRYPVLIYRNAFAERGDEGAAWLMKHFAKNNWSNFWRSGIFTYHHYHSTAHEVLGIYEGTTGLQLGGEQGNKVKVSEGDIIVIPAGVGHKNLNRANDVKVVGAYDSNRNYDILTGKADERPDSVNNIHTVPYPGADPLTGTGTGLCTIWK